MWQKAREKVLEGCAGEEGTLCSDHRVLGGSLRAVHWSSPQPPREWTSLGSTALLGSVRGSSVHRCGAVGPFGARSPSRPNTPGAGAREVSVGSES